MKNSLDIIEETMNRANRAENQASYGWNTAHTRWSCEQAILNREDGISMDEAAEMWLKSTIANGLLEDDKGVLEFMANHNI